MRSLGAGRLGRAVVIGLVFAAVSAAPATAGTVRTGSTDLTVQPIYAPKDVTIAGGEVVWFLEGFNGYTDEYLPPTLQSASGDGPARTLWDGSSDGHACHSVSDLSASPGYVAFMFTAFDKSARPSDGRVGCEGYGIETPVPKVQVLRTDGTPVPVDCRVDDFFLSGDELACVAPDAYGGAVIHNLRTGAAETVGVPTDGSWSLAGFAGQYLAFGHDGVIVVWNRLTQAEVYRFDPAPLLTPPSWGGRTFDLADDGSVVFSSQSDDPYGPVSVVAAAPGVPAHLLPIGVMREPVNIGGGLISANRYVPDHPIGDVVLMDLAGNVVSETAYCRRPSDFDGTTVAWIADNFNSQFPDTRIRTEHAGYVEPARTDCPWFHFAGPGAPPGPPAPPAAGPPPVVAHRTLRCSVPPLHGRTLAIARRRLTTAGCRLGRVTRLGKAAHTARSRAVVVRQTPRAGRSRPLHTRVRVVLKARRH